MSVTESSWQQATAAIQQAQRLLLLGHVNPDADALGSALGVGIALKKAGKDVVVSFGDDPFVVARALRTLPGQDLLVPSRDVRGPFDVVMSFDVAAIERLGVLRVFADEAPVFICVDHHRSNVGMGSINIIDPGAEATAAMAMDLIERLGLPLDKESAACLYAGLSTDTGSFKFISTTSATHERAARLLATGIEHHLISRAMYDDEPFDTVRLIGKALVNAELLPQGIVITSISAQDRQAAGLGLEQIERIIDSIRITSEAEVAVVLKQDDAGVWLASVRSKGAIDVGAAMSSIGGGGHKYAAGATLGADYEKSRRTVLEAIHA